MFRKGKQILHPSCFSCYKPGNLSRHDISEKICIWRVHYKVDIYIPMQSVPITTDVVSSSLDQGELLKVALDTIKQTTI